MKPNRYIKAMEIGLAHEKEGISYHKLLEKMNADLGEPMDSGAEKTFIAWFVENFSSDFFKESNEQIKKSFTFYLEKRSGKALDKARDIAANKVRLNLSKLYWLDGQAAKQYLDYQELVESRKASTQAKKQSNISIGIAIFALVVSSVLGIFSMMTAPKPPYDVKIIENNPQNLELKQIKDKLHKAEMKLRAYELDSVLGADS